MSAQASRTAATAVPPLPDEVDGIFVGAGHNALVAAAYLARTGASVLVLEATGQIGGGVVTSEMTLPLFRHNPHAFFVRWTSDYKLWSDLELDRFGTRTIMPEVQYSLAYGGGERALVMYNDMARTIASLAELSPADAKAYERLMPEWRDFVTKLVGPLYLATPLPDEELRGLLEQSDLGRRFLDQADRSALDVIRDWFESEPMRALAAFVCSVRGYLSVMDVPGTGHLPALALFTAPFGRLTEGGSFEVVRAIAEAVYAAGGRIAVDSRVASIDVVDGRARGITTTDGRTVRARKFVASSVPAPITLLELAGRSHLDPALASALDGYQWRDEGLFGVHYALERPPAFLAEKHNPDFGRSLNMALGLESTTTMEEHIAALRASREPEHSALHAALPTVHDPSQAPASLHTGFAWEEVPVRAADGSALPWDQAASDRQAQNMLATWERYAPGFSEHVLSATTHSSRDTEAGNPAMRLGDWHHGSYHPDNWGYNRPCPELAEYRTPIDGLYLCGSSQHPGGSFSGMPGHNAAGVIADDHGLEVWWQRPPLRAILGGLAGAPQQA